MRYINCGRFIGWIVKKRTIDGLEKSGLICYTPASFILAPAIHKSTTCPYPMVSHNQDGPSARAKHNHNADEQLLTTRSRPITKYPRAETSKLE